MRADGLTRLTTVAVAALLAVWLSAALMSTRSVPALPEPDARARHVTMIEQMRRGVSPQMIERMNEPAWRQLRQPGMLAEMEAHQRASDRMLARKP